ARPADLPSLAEDAALAAAALRWLAGLFLAPPGPDGMAALRQVLPTLAGDAALGPALAGMADRLSALEDPDRDLAIAFNRLFVGAGGPETVAPYESARAEPHGRLFGTATAEMADLLEQLDLRVAIAEPPDHLAVELQLLAQLAATGDPREAMLLRRLGGWVPSFRDACAARDPTGFYAAAAAALSTLLDGRAAVIAPTLHAID
ncbi:MAG: molecular chaperone TorD family protein, partial [Dongiaceae bacterium]